MKFFSNSKALKIMLLLLTGLYIYGLWQRDVDIDDAWIGEHAYWLSEIGYVKSELMRGIIQSEEYLIIHHKLLTLQGALFIRLFGFSVYSLKAVSLVYFIFFLIIFYKYTVNRRGLLNRKDFLLAMIILLSFPWLFKFSFIFRPETILMTLGLLSFIWLEKTVTTPGKSYWNTIFAGLICGLSIATHLNGLILYGTGMIMLLLFRKPKDLVIFSISGTIGALPYFYDFNSTYGIQYWLKQFTSNPALDKTLERPILLSLLHSLTEEYKRYFFYPTIFVFSFFFFVSLFSGFKYLLRNNRFLLTYTIVLLVLLAVVAFHKSQQYILLALPMMVLIMVIVWREISNGKINLQSFPIPKLLHGLYVLMISAFLILSIYANAELAMKKFSKAEIRSIVAGYIHEDCSSVNIIAPLRFIFNEIKNFNRIHGEVCYVEFQKSNPSIKGEGFLQRANSYDISYIFLTPYYRNMLGLDNMDTIQNKHGYYILHDDKMLILGRFFDYK